MNVVLNLPLAFVLFTSKEMVETMSSFCFMIDFLALSRSIPYVNKNTDRCQSMYPRRGLLRKRWWKLGESFFLFRDYFPNTLG